MGNSESKCVTLSGKGLRLRLWSLNSPNISEINPFGLLKRLHPSESSQQEPTPKRLHGELQICNQVY